MIQVARALNMIRIVPGSFRDPSGFLYIQDGRIYRQVNKLYKEDYDCLMRSGLYDDLTESGLMISHREVDGQGSDRSAYKTLDPEQMNFISYPYEWCFGQLKDAALATLEIQRKAIQYGMSLKDASAYNVQFRNLKPLLIDTLSFERYQKGCPWKAYRQFCQHFLAPLAVMSYRDVRLNQLFRIFMDGFPLDLASSLLPLRTFLKFRFTSHIHIHSMMQKRHGGRAVRLEGREMGLKSLLGLIDHLEQAIRDIKWKPGGTEWAEYYEKTNYPSDSFRNKNELVHKFLRVARPRIVWDLGANDGTFSRVAACAGITSIIALDNDPSAVEKHYQSNKKEGFTNVLPLIVDLTNPSAAIGWENTERCSLIERGPADVVLALALIHHLAISNNVPLGKIAQFLSRIGRALIIEFVPKSDSMVQRLLSTRKDIFPDYTREGFERAFSEYFLIREREGVADSERSIYFMSGLK
jgi:hypothetical protein